VKGVNRPKRFNVLIVPSDGSAPFRFRLPRWSVYAALTAVAIAVASLSAVVGDYLRVRHLNRDTLALHSELAEQQSLIDALHRRVGEVRLEVATWRDLHAKIWEPFGPDAGPGRNTRGIGGAQPPATEPPPGPRPSALEELDRLAETVSEEGQSLRALERLMARAGRALALLPSRWPVRGGVNSEFGSRSSPWTQGTEFHGGMDIAADRGTPVRAPAPGKVVAAGPMGEYGVGVMIEHRPDLRTLYGHLSKVSVIPGQAVERGQVIALTGNTGKSSGPHLHYEILVKGQSVNPRAYLWE
jgi:murein DD-endopeptidase MepM/ murein hydrolase activator NlpD